MIEESELAKTFRQDEKKQQVDEPPATIITGERVVISTSPVPPPAAGDGVTSTDVVAQAKACKAELEDLLSRSPSSSSSPMSPTQALDPGLAQRTRNILASLARVIEGTSEPDQLQELLTLNDDLTGMLTHSVGPPLVGLGIRIDTAAANANTNGSSAVNGNATPTIVTTNGHIELSDAEEEPMTPRVDKGKGRAEPEPEEPEKVLSPTIMSPAFLISESDDEEAEGRLILEEHLEASVSPTDR